MSALIAKGLNGQITFDGATVVITREGFVGRATHGRSDKALPVTAISAVQFRPATALVNGFIQFSMSGETSKRSIGFGKGGDASRDENAVLFRKGASDDFQALADAIRTAQTGAPAAGTDVTDQLAKLAALRDSGVLTDAEFTEKKSELLSRL